MTRDALKRLLQAIPGDVVDNRAPSIGSFARFQGDVPADLPTSSSPSASCLACATRA